MDNKTLLEALAGMGRDVSALPYRALGMSSPFPEGAAFNNTPSYWSMLGESLKPLATSEPNQWGSGDVPRYENYVRNAIGIALMGAGAQQGFQQMGQGLNQLKYNFLTNAALGRVGRAYPNAISSQPQLSDLNRQVGEYVSKRFFPETAGTINMYAGLPVKTGQPGTFQTNLLPVSPQMSAIPKLRTTSGTTIEAPSLFHETSSYGLEGLMAYGNASGLNVSTDKDLALGQKGKGILVELDGQKLLGDRGSLRPIKKPATNFVGQKEFELVGGENKPGTIKSITLQPGTKITRVQAAIFRRDYDKVINPDESITLTPKILSND